MKRVFWPSALLTVALTMSAGVPSTVRGAPTRSSQPGNVLAWGANDSGQLGLGPSPSDALVHVSGLPVVVAVAGGTEFTLVVTRAGSVWAWGLNDHGQLGIGNTTASASPMQVHGLRNIVAVACGVQHSLALAGDGTVWAWGENRYGERGRGGKGDSLTPVHLTDLHHVVAIAAGGWRSLALLRDGTVWAWGASDAWQVAGAVDDTSGIPVQVPGLRNVVRIARGTRLSLALTASGAVWVWGDNDQGQAGKGASIGDTIDTPVQVSGLPAVAAIAGGDLHSVALGRDGTVWAWGNNSYAQLAVAKVAGTCGSFPCTAAPVHVSGLPPVAAISAGGNHTVAMARSGTIWTWGGKSTTKSGSAPSLVPNLVNAAAVVAGSDHNLAVGRDGSLTAWGANGSGQLGIAAPQVCGTQIEVRCQTRPVITYGQLHAIAIASGTSHSLALARDGTVWAWGGNTSGLLGDGTTISRDTPVQVHGLQSIRAVAAGDLHSLALGRDGTVWAWGDNAAGQLGNGSTRASTIPLRVRSLHGIIAIAAGGGFSLALQHDGTVWAWGFNAFGQLGIATRHACSQDIKCLTVPSRVRGLAVITAIVASGTSGMALGRDGMVWAWGSNTDGQLGTGNTSDSAAPTRVHGLHDIVAIAGGTDPISANFSMALGRNGMVWAWGSNSDGQLGTGNTTDSTVPVQVRGLGSVAAIAAGSSHGLALRHDGTVWAWGSNNEGQLGATARQKCTLEEPCGTIPVQVQGLHAITAIASGGTSSLAITSAPG